MADSVYFDTGVLWSFSVAGALHRLETAYADRAMWVPAVQREVRYYANQEPHLHDVLNARWLTLHQFDPDDLTTTKAIDDIRRSFKPVGGPRKHLGESESIVAVRGTDAWFFTEDYDAKDKAEFEGVHRTRMTTEVLRELVSTEVIDCSESIRLYEAMRAGGRQIPDDLGTADLCW